MPVKPLSADQLYTTLDPATLPFARTDEASDHNRPVGQDRAVEAVRFAIGMRGPGYNLFCMGPEGTGKASLVHRFIAEAAASQPMPDDWCYVHNFDEPNRPRALRLPTGRAKALEEGTERLIEDLRHAIPAAFEAEEYRTQRKAIEDEFQERQEKLLEEHRQRAEEKSIALVRTPAGLALAPVKNDEVLGPEEFKALPEDEQDRLREVMSALQTELEETLRQVPKWEREKRDRIKGLDHAVTDACAAHLIDDLRLAFGDCAKVLEHLDKLAKDVTDNVALFLPDAGEQEQLPPQLRRDMADGRFRRYQVNVLISHAANNGAPVVVEDHPTQPNLIGRIEHRQQFGALVTDFRLIKPGSLHKANGGYLILEARKLLMNPFAWDDLKRALRRHEICIEAPGATWGVWSTQSLEPEAIPLDLKVVLLGEPMLFYLLSDHDPDFGELFKAQADFNIRMPRNNDNTREQALLLADVARQRAILPLDASAIARVIEHGSRLADDATKLTTHMGNLVDLMREADHYARRDEAEVITADHVRTAIAGQHRRVDRIPTAVREEIEHEIIHIATEGAEVGQINGLAVMEIGPMAFGKPSRISVRVRMGRGELTDIERESDLSGPLHSKGVMILTSFLSHRFAEDGPLALSATIVFEQSYGMVDGDSASSTELYALLSALSGKPVRQDLAVTGSVDQFGRVQAIGGVNEKIEGFFDLCASRGLTGTQGVLIPASNVRHLMLRDDVVQACREGKFAIYPIQTVDEGIALLTGAPAGTKDERGDWDFGSVNRAVAARLAGWARRAREQAQDGPERSPNHGRRRPLPAVIDDGDDDSSED